MCKIVSQNCGKIFPDSIDEYINVGGYNGLKKALSIGREKIIEEVKKSGLRGRGGAAFPTGLKWEMVLNSEGKKKYVVCNADEGEPVTFKDKILLDGDPHRIIEGMAIAGYAVGSDKGFIYIRGEYPHSANHIAKAIKDAIDYGYLGKNILNSGFNFDIEIRQGAGSYICGEETALIESIEGKRGVSRLKPPYPTTVGLWNMPTLVNNVETFANIPYIIVSGWESFKKIGTENSSGTKLVPLSGNIVNKGVYEVPFGMALKDIIYKIGGGVEGGELKLVQVGGSSGFCVTPEMLDIKLDFDEFAKSGLSIGSGAILVVNNKNCIIELVKCILNFFKHESCGKCTPCREGIKHLYKILDKFSKGKATERDIELLFEISFAMQQASSCGLGQTAPTALLSTLKYFREEYEEHINGKCKAGVCNFGIEGGKLS